MYIAAHVYGYRRVMCDLDFTLQTRVWIMTQSVPSKPLDTYIREVSRIPCDDVRMSGTGNDDRLDAQDSTC